MHQVHEFMLDICSSLKPNRSRESQTRCRYTWKGTQNTGRKKRGLWFSKPELNHSQRTFKKDDPRHSKPAKKKARRGPLFVGVKLPARPLFKGDTLSGLWRRGFLAKLDSFHLAEAADHPGSALLFFFCVLRSGNPFLGGLDCYLKPRSFSNL